MLMTAKVYNMTPYIGFHPGGVKYIMMGAGRDATVLFNKYHAWVNLDFLMAKCMVGLLEPPSDRVTGRAGPHAHASPPLPVPMAEPAPKLAAAESIAESAAAEAASKPVAAEAAEEMGVAVESAATELTAVEKEGSVLGDVGG